MHIIAFILLSCLYYARRLKQKDETPIFLLHGTTLNISMGGVRTQIWTMYPDGIHGPGQAHNLAICLTKFLAFIAEILTLVLSSSIRAVLNGFEKLDGAFSAIYYAGRQHHPHLSPRSPVLRVMGHQFELLDKQRARLQPSCWGTASYHLG